MEILEAQQQFETLAVNRKYHESMKLIDELVTTGNKPETIMTDVIARSLANLQSFDESPEASGYSSLTLLAIAKICSDALAKVEGQIDKKADSKGKVVFGTPVNEHHSIGKTIVVAILKSSGYEVVDIGVNQPATAFVKAAEENNANFILVSTFLLQSAFKIAEIAKLLKSSPVAEKTKLIAGGPPFNFHLGLADKLGIDGSAVDAFDTVRVLDEFQGYRSAYEDKMSGKGRFKWLKGRVFKFGRRK